MKKIYPCIIGLGYVGLPLFVRLKKNFVLLALIPTITELDILIKE